MLKLLRTLVNNGFVVLGLLIAVTLYLAYGQRPDSHTPAPNAAAAATPAVQPAASPTEAGATEVAQADEAAAEKAEPAPEPTPEAAQEDSAAPAAAEAPSTTQAASSEAPHSPVADETDGGKTAAQASEKAAAGTEEAEVASPPESASTTAAADTTAGATGNTPDHKPASAPSGAEAESAPARPPAPPAATQPVRGLLFDPARLDHRAVLRRFASPEQALAEARAAARGGDPQWAAAIYFSLLKVQPKADLAGELGNLLWRLGDDIWARRAWRYAAQLLIREGRVDTARAFARNIRQVDAALADEIEAHLPKASPKQTEQPKS